jgi:hypothetical protein
LSYLDSKNYTLTRPGYDQTYDLIAEPSKMKIRDHGFHASRPNRGEIKKHGRNKPNTKNAKVS